MFGNAYGTLLLDGCILFHQMKNFQRPRPGQMISRPIKELWVEDPVRPPRMGEWTISRVRPIPSSTTHVLQHWSEADLMRNTPKMAPFCRLSCIKFPCWLFGPKKIDQLSEKGRGFGADRSTHFTVEHWLHECISFAAADVNRARLMNGVTANYAVKYQQALSCWRRSTHKKDWNFYLTSK